MQLWDTAGQERFRLSMVRHYYKNAHAIVFVYDVTDPVSFDNLKRWMEESDLNVLGNVPRILVGNKCDGIVRVTTNVAQKFADQYNMPVSIGYPIKYKFIYNKSTIFSSLRLQQG